MHRWGMKRDPAYSHCIEARNYTPFATGLRNCQDTCFDAIRMQISLNFIYNQGWQHVLWPRITQCQKFKLNLLAISKAIRGRIGGAVYN